MGFVLTSLNSGLLEAKCSPNSDRNQQVGSVRHPIPCRGGDKGSESQFWLFPVPPGPCFLLYPGLQGTVGPEPPRQILYSQC